MPWPEEPGLAADLGLAVAVGLALQLEDLGLNVQIKWPNDLLVDGRKLAGLLPRLRIRGGRIRWARLGLGLNGSNRVPPGAISVAEALGRKLTAGERAALAARALIALDWAASQGHEPEAVRLQANRRLRLPPGGALARGAVAAAGSDPRWRPGSGPGRSSGDAHPPLLSRATADWMPGWISTPVLRIPCSK